LKRRRIVKIAALAVALAGVVAYWSTGRMDPALSQVGLNATDCAQNGFGNWLCGDALERAKREEKQAEREAERGRIREAEYKLTIERYSKCADDFSTSDPDVIARFCGPEPQAP
jgi:hypothetical protein